MPPIPFQETADLALEMLGSLHTHNDKRVELLARQIVENDPDTAIELIQILAVLSHGFLERLARHVGATVPDYLRELLAVNHDPDH